MNTINRSAQGYASDSIKTKTKNNQLLNQNKNAMKKLMSRLTAIAFLGTVVFLASCSKDDDKKASKPSLTLGQSTLNIKQDSTKTFTVGISASGGIKDITVTTNTGVGTATVTNKTDLIGKSFGTATISYTAPDVIEASDNITITVVDNVQQQTTAAVTVNITANPPVEIEGVTSTVEGAPAGYKSYHITTPTVWGPNRTYHITSDVIIDPSASLTVQSGTTVIVDGPYTIEVKGNFYSYGTAAEPVLFTVPEQNRTKDNIFTGSWGGILSSNYDPTDKTQVGKGWGSSHIYTTTEMVVLYTRIEFVGLPSDQLGYEVTDIATIGETDPTASAPTYALFFNNPTGTFVVENSTFAYTKDVAVQVDQGKILIDHNTFIFNGEAGGESIDIKGGTTGDIAFNVFYKQAVNAVKWNDKPANIPNTDLHIYNNTIVQGGWRTAPGDFPTHGGSLDAETNALGTVYNNLIVSCGKGVRFAKDKVPNVASLKDGYNLMYGNDTLSVYYFYPPTTGYINPQSANYAYETAHDVADTVNIGANDPKFVSFDVTKFGNAEANASQSGTDVTLIDLTTFDFHLQSSSPALTKGKTDFSSFFPSLTAGSKTYSAPAPANYIGAFGTK